MWIRRANVETTRRSFAPGAAAPAPRCRGAGRPRRSPPPFDVRRLVASIFVDVSAKGTFHHPSRGQCWVRCKTDAGQPRDPSSRRFRKRPFKARGREPWPFQAVGFGDTKMTHLPRCLDDQKGHSQWSHPKESLHTPNHTESLRETLQKPSGTCSARFVRIDANLSE